MKKKMTVMILLMAMAIFGIEMYVQAIPSDYYAEQWTSIEDRFVTWDITMQNGAYIVRSNKVYFEMIEIDSYHFSTGFMHELFEEQVFIASYNGVSSSIKVYDEATSSTPIAEHYFSYESPEATELLINPSFFEGGFEAGTFIQIMLILNPSETASRREIIRSGMSEYYDFYIHGFVREVPFQDVNYITPSELPITEGNINESGKVGYVSYRIEGSLVSLRIVYDNTAYYVQKNLSDVGFLQRENIAYYYVDDVTGDPIIYLDYGSESIPFLFDTTSTSSKWRPFLLWNLDTNEIYSTDKVTVVSHVQTEEAHNVFSYFYMPYIDYDDILQVQIDFDYRFTNSGFLVTIGAQPGYSDTRSKMMVLERDNVTETTPDFVYNAYNFGMTSMAIGAGLMLIPFPAVQSTGMLLFFGGIATYLTATAIDEFELATTLIDNIQPFTPTTSFREFLQEKYRIASGIDDLTIEATDQLHRLHLGQFEIPTGFKNVEIVPGTFQYTHIIYQYRDQVIEIERPYIDDFHNYEGEHPFEPTPEDPVKPDYTWYSNPLIYMGVGLVVLFSGVLMFMRKDDEDVRSVGKRARYPRIHQS
ncbi:MAG TPA: hypothetical protein PLP48_00390 [Acholeplasmataceae bacterium]|nr:hypothetical protein [Acholeplasmataceae bacterium]